MIKQIFTLQPASTLPTLPDTVQLVQNKMSLLKALYLDNEYLFSAQTHLAAAQLPLAFQNDFSQGTHWSDLMVDMNSKTSSLIQSYYTEPVTCRFAESLELISKIELLIEMIYRQIERLARSYSAQVLQLNAHKIAC